MATLSNALSFRSSDNQHLLRSSEIHSEPSLHDFPGEGKGDSHRIRAALLSSLITAMARAAIITFRESSLPCSVFFSKFQNTYAISLKKKILAFCVSSSYCADLCRCELTLSSCTPLLFPPVIFQGKIRKRVSICAGLDSLLYCLFLWSSLLMLEVIASRSLFWPESSFPRGNSLKNIHRDTESTCQWEPLCYGRRFSPRAWRGQLRLPFHSH